MHNNLLQKQATGFQFQGAAMPFGDVKNLLTEMMKDVEGNLPPPNLKIVNNTQPTWNGRCTWTYGEPTTTIELQKSITHDEPTLRRVLAHELAHHEAFLAHFAKMSPQTYRTMWRIEGGHGKTWMDIVARWNAKYGADFITRTSDQTKVHVYDEKPFYVLLWNSPRGIRWQSSINLSVQAVKAMWAGGQKTPDRAQQYKLVRTTDRDLLSRLNIGSSSFGYSSDAAIMDKAAKLFETGTDLWEQEVTNRVNAPAKPIAKFFVLLNKRKYGEGDYLWQQASALNESQKEHLGRYARMTAGGTTEAKLVMSTNIFLKAGSRLGGTSWSYPRTPEEHAALAEAWESPDLLQKYKDVRHRFFSSLLHKASPDFGYTKYHNREKDLKKVKFVSQGREGDYFGVAAKFGGKDIGAIECAITVRLATVYNIWIDGTWRGTGLGQLLYDHAIQVAKKIGMDYFSSDDQLTDDAVSAWMRLRKRYPMDEVDNMDYDPDAEYDGSVPQHPVRYRIDLDDVPAKNLGTVKSAAINPADRTLYHGTNTTEKFNVVKPMWGDPVVWLGELDTARDIYSRQIRGGRSRVFEVKLKPDTKIADLLDESQPCTEKVRNYFLRVVGYKVLDHAWSDVMNYVAFHNHDHVLIGMLKDMGFDGAIVMDKGRPPGGPSRNHHSVALWNIDAIEFQQEMKTAAYPKTKWEQMMESEEYKWLPAAYERELNEPWVEYVPISQLMPLREYLWNENYNRNGADEFADMVEDIKRHGVRSVITIRYFKDTNTALIIEGNHRLAAARAAGLTELPARVTIAKYPRKEYGSDIGGQKGGPVRGLKDPNERIFSDYIKPSDIGLTGSKKTAATTVTYPKKRKPKAYHFQPVPFEQFLQDEGFASEAANMDEEELQHREMEYDENVEHFGTLDFPCTIYRQVELPPGKSINFDEAGVYWSWVEDSAQAYFGGSSMWSPGGHDKGEYVTIKAQVLHPSDVDWQGTLRANFIDPEENELRVLPGAQLKLIGVQGENDSTYKPVPGQMTITATQNPPQGLEMETSYDWHEYGDPDLDQNQLYVFAKLNGEIVGEADFIIKSDHLLPNNVKVEEPYRRKGIASAIYAFAQRETGLTVRPHSIQTKDGYSLWNQNNDRKFGSYHKRYDHANLPSFHDLFMSGNPGCSFGIYDLLGGEDDWQPYEDEAERLAAEKGVQLESMESEEKDQWIFNNIARADLELKFNAVRDRFAKMQFPVTAYRAVDLKKGLPELRTDLLKKKNPKNKLVPWSQEAFGHAWAWDEKGADNYGSNFNGNNDYTYVFRGLITSPNDVDWETTLQVNFLMPEEHELRIIDGSIIQITGYKKPRTKEWLPPEGGFKTVTASHKQTPLSDTTFPNMDKLDGEGTNAYALQPERVEGNSLMPSLEAMVPGAKIGDLEGDGPSSFFEEVENPHSVQPLRAPDDANGDTMFPNKIGNIAKGADFTDDWDDRFDDLEPEETEYPNYVSGECWQYTIALVQLTGWAPYIINDSEEGPVHAVVLDPRNKKFLDARGLFTLKQLGKYYGLVKPFATPTKVEGLEAMCDPDDEEIEDAKVVAIEQLKKLGIPAKTAAGFPIKSFKKLWHVGDMDISKKKPGSHEGSGLSVSVNPHEWQQISRGTAGPTWELTKPGNKFLNYHSLTDAQTSTIGLWGIAEGYAEAQTVYRVSWYDDELEDTMFTDYPTKQQAEYEAGGEDGYEVTEVPGELTPTAKLHARMGEKVDQAFVDDFIAAVYAEDKLGYDGVWWDDYLDVSAYSAPRGVIFNSKLPTWKTVKIKQGKVATAATSVLPNSFEQFCQKHGGFMKLFGEIADFGSGDWDQYGEFYDTEEQEEFDALLDSEKEKVMEKRAYEDWEDRYNNLRWQHTRWTWPLKVWRCVTLKNIQELKTKGIGVYWSYEESAAQAHWGSGGKPYTLEGQILESAVDWDNTICVNLHPSLGEDEKEIRLNDGARVQLLRWQDPTGKWHPALKEWKSVKASKSEEITGKGWLTPEGDFIPCKGRTHGAVAETFNLPKAKGTAESIAMRNGYVRVVFDDYYVHPGDISNKEKGWKAYLEFGTQQDAYKRAGDIIRMTPPSISRVDVEWHKPTPGYLRMTLAEAEEKFPSQGLYWDKGLKAAGAGDANNYIPRLHVDTPALHSDPVDEAMTDQEAWDAALPDHKVGHVNNDLVWLKQYLTMDDASKGEELSRVFTPTFTEFVENNFPEVWEEVKDRVEDGYLDSPEGIPPEVFASFYKDGGADDCMAMDPAECPSFMHMDYRGIVKNQWLVHKTDDPDGICSKGFTYGMSDLARLGLTTWYKNEGMDKQTGGYNFAFLPEDRGIESKYGKDAVIFRASGVEVYHWGDEETQVIFRGSEAHDIIPVYKRDGDWQLSENAQGKPVFTAPTLAQIVQWVEAHYAQYRKVIVKRADYEQQALPYMDEYDIYQNHFDDEQTVASHILGEYAEHKDDPNYRMDWDLVPAARLVKIWNDYMSTGFVRDVKGIDMIAEIILTNIAKLNVNTILCGHGTDDPVSYASNITGEDYPEDYFDNDNAFFEDSKGSWLISDYALKPLAQDELKLRQARTPEQKLQIIDHILNIIHQRSDLAGWFVEGGQSTLNRLAGTGDSLKPDLKPQKPSPTPKKTTPKPKSRG